MRGLNERSLEGAFEEKKHCAEIKEARLTSEWEKGYGMIFLKFIVLIQSFLFFFFSVGFF